MEQKIKRTFLSLVLVDVVGRMLLIKMNRSFVRETLVTKKEDNIAFGEHCTTSRYVTVALLSLSVDFEVDLVVCDVVEFDVERLVEFVLIRK